MISARRPVKIAACSTAFTGSVSTLPPTTPSGFTTWATDGRVCRTVVRPSANLATCGTKSLS
jgi:hypothetical protein